MFGIRRDILGGEANRQAEQSRYGAEQDQRNRDAIWNMFGNLYGAGVQSGASGSGTGGTK